MKLSHLLFLCVLACSLHVAVTTNPAAVAAGAGLLAVAKIGLLAKVKLAALLSSEDGHYHDYGYGPYGNYYYYHPHGHHYHYDLYGHHDSYGHDDHGHFRRRRDTSDVENVKQLHNYLSEAERVDDLDCGKRMVCEISAADVSSLSEEEKLIRALFGVPKKVTFDDLKKPEGRYEFAASIGYHMKSSSLCAKMYHTCPNSSREIIAALRGSQKS